MLLGQTNLINKYSCSLCRHVIVRRLVLGNNHRSLKSLRHPIGMDQYTTLPVRLVGHSVVEEKRSGDVRA